MSDIKLIALDIDKTLIDDKMQVPPRNIEAIHRAKEAGVNVVIVSGRSGKSVRNYMNKIGFQDLVPSLGGTLISKWNHEIVSDFGISCEDAQIINSIVRKYGHFIHAFKLDEWYTDPENEYWKQKEIEATSFEGIYCEMGEFLKTNRPNKILVPSLYKEVIEGISREVYEKVGERVITFLSSPTYLEIMPRGINKGTAVENVAKFYDISRSQVLAVGDYYNDVDMFKVAGHTACPSNAHDDIKSMVEYVSPFDNNNSAVAEIIYKFLGIK